MSGGPYLVSGSLPPSGRYEVDIIILTMGRLEATLAAVASAVRQAHVSRYVALLDQGNDPVARAHYVSVFAGCEDGGYYVSDVNLGVGGGRNFLAGVGHGDAIVALDNDAVFGDGFVALDAVRIFRDSPLLGVLAFRIMDAAGRDLDARSWGYPPALQALDDKRFLTTTFVGAGHAIRRTAWEAAGGYDERLFFTWEEYDFALRAICRGWLVEYRGELRVFHKAELESRVRWLGGRTRVYVRNRLMIARKWGAGWVELAPRIVGYLVKGARSGGILAVVRGVAGALARDAGLEKRAMPAAMRRYVREHEMTHRGPVLQRLGPEVFGRFGEAPPARISDDRAPAGRATAGRAKG